MECHPGMCGLQNEMTRSGVTGNRNSEKDLTFGGRTQKVGTGHSIKFGEIFKKTSKSLMFFSILLWHTG